MADSRGGAGGAPNYDRLGIDQKTAVPSMPVYLERVVAAVRFGWELEELIACSYLLGEPKPRIPIPGSPEDAQNAMAEEEHVFLPDLFHRQSPEDRLKSVLTIVRAQPALMFPKEYPAAPTAEAADNTTDQTQPTNAPSPELLDKLAEAIGQLPTNISSTGSQNSGPRYFPEVTSTVRRIDHALIDIVLDPIYTGQTGAVADPAPSLLLSGYELGKALSGTRWLLWAAHMLTSYENPEIPVPPPNAEKVRPAWTAMFDSGRIAAIQRQLGNLSPVYGGRITLPVAKSLDYWRAALLDPYIVNLPDGQRRANRTRQASVPWGRTEFNHGVWTRTEAEVRLDFDNDDIEGELVLFAALGQQVDAWYDLLTLRRTPEDFPVTGVISNLLRQLAAQEFKAATSLLSPVLRTAGVAFAVVALLVVVAMVFALLFAPATAQPLAAGGILAVGSALVGTVAAVFTRQSAGSKQSGAADPGIDQRLGQVEGQLQAGLGAVRQDLTAIQQTIASAGVERTVQEVAARVGSGVQPHLANDFSWRAVIQNAATDVINQLQLEEIYLGVSEPLVRYVLGTEVRNGADVIGDPQAAARRFLGMIYDSTPNIDRLSGVLMELYRAATTGGPPSSASGKTPPTS